MTMIQHKNIFMFKYKYVFMLKYKKINIDLCFYVLYTYFRGNTKKKPPISQQGVQIMQLNHIIISLLIASQTGRPVHIPAMKGKEFAEFMSLLRVALQS